MSTARRAKIVCTIGPTSRDERTLAELVARGMDVARLNMSHGTREEHGEVIARVRRIAEQQGRAVAVLQDLSGPKIRLGTLAEPVLLRAGEEVVLTTEEVEGRGHLLPVAYPPLVDELNEGDRLSLADGAVMLEVLARQGPALKARVMTNGKVSSHKGVNLPTAGMSLPAVTDKDVEDLRFGLAQGVDWVALSFVRSPGDAGAARAVMEQEGRHVPLLAKVEKPQAVERIGEILRAFDGLMVARGDLGVEVPMEDVPRIQKDLIRRANRAAKPVITATQMLLSMVTSPGPTRAEVTDVANAVLDGTDAVMLSEETAQGEHPAAAVTAMARIAAAAEELRHECEVVDLDQPEAPSAIARATRQVAAQVGAALIVTPTTSGTTARLVAATRPAIPILALSSQAETVAQLALSWGVVPRRIRHVTQTDELFALCCAQALESGLARPGDRVVLTAGLPIEVRGTTNVLRVIEL